MLEEDAKTKMCPHMLMSMKLGVLAVAVMPNTNAAGFEEAVDFAVKSKAEKCQGSRCMFWDGWTKREYVDTEWGEGKDEIKPDGDGWKKQGGNNRIATFEGPVIIRAKWHRDVPNGMGECGLKWQAE